MFVFNPTPSHGNGLLYANKASEKKKQTEKDTEKKRSDKQKKPKKKERRRVNGKQNWNMCSVRDG